MDKEKYPFISKETYICRRNVLQSIQDSKNFAIKQIMRIVENNVDPYSDRKVHDNIRSVVLDEINDMARDFAEILERAYSENGTSDKNR